MASLIVGAGLSGATIARKLAERGESVLVIDQRDHIAGNTYDYIDQATGIRLSKYGAHIFHTNSDRVWDFCNQYSEWVPYEHRVLSYIDGSHVPVPVNIDTVNTLFGLDIKTEAEMKDWLKTNQVKGEVTNSKEAALARVGEKLYKLMFENYTIKQWDKDPSELEPSVLERIPVRSDHNDRYFSDKYEALPKNGYTEFVSNILDHENIEVRLSTPYSKDLDRDIIVFTGRVDSYFGNKYGALEYRSLDFEYTTHDIEDYQPAAVVNYPSLDYPYTRKIDYKKFYPIDSDKSIVAEEYSTDVGEPYYPVPSEKNREIYAKYQKEAKKLEKRGIYFVGRLAEYKYFNMDQAILSALDMSDIITVK